jgi:hypothetical protein
VIVTLFPFDENSGAGLPASVIVRIMRSIPIFQRKKGKGEVGLGQAKLLI